MKRTKKSPEEFKEAHRIAQKKYMSRPDWKEIRTRYKKIRSDNPITKAHDALKCTNRKLINTYGISLEDYNNILVEQKEKCYICERHKSEFKKGLCVDHCHKTGKVRALLCGNCNSAIGKLQESEVLFRKAIKYLAKWKK